MSLVTDVLLTFDLEERFDDDFNVLESCEALDAINGWLEDHGQGKLDELSAHVVSSGKSMMCHVYGGAFDYLELDDFVGLALSQNWKLPEAVMLLTRHEGQDAFVLHKI